jgi:hypothetical protein
MRGLLLLTAATAFAQDNRGFFNERLLTQNFVKNSLKPKAKAVIVTTQPSPRCAIPLLKVVPSKDTDPGILLPMGKNSGDEKMILPTIPVCADK